MESTFLSKENIENIYEYLNTQTVHNYNVNLDSNEKYKKITKKLAKTIYKNLYTTIQHMSINEFNDLVVNKSMPFIKQNLDKDIVKIKSLNSQDVQNFNSHNINYADVDLSKLNNIDLTSSLKLVGDKDKNKQVKKTKKPKKKSNNEEYQEYLNDALEFDSLIKQSNDKIKDNFKKLIKKPQNNFVKECDIQDTNKFVMDRCIAKDNMLEKGLSKSAFEEIVEKKTINNISDNQVSSITSPTNSLYPTSAISQNNINSMTEETNTNANANSNSGEDLLDYYDKSQINYKKLFSHIMVNQKDNSKSNKVDSYEGEMYLPNLISNYGEEAPIQPLLYQNTKTGSEIINNFSVIIDTGNNVGTSDDPTNINDLTSDANGNVVTHTGNFPWQNFRVNLDDTFRIDKITDVYLKSFTLYGATSTASCLYFVLNIEEFNLRSQSNNPNLKSKIIIQNTTSTGGKDVVFSKSYSRYENYLTTITPSNFTNLNIELTNQNNNGSEDGDDRTFALRTAKTNRIIFELDFVTRKLKDPIFDYTITKETAELAAST